MKQNLQSVMEPKPWHPDADRLTAFAEQALSQHEREQTLAHLAACAACRETIFLAQQASTVEVPQPAPVRRPWFAGWNLVWPAVAALAAVAGFSVFLRHDTRIESPAPVTVAIFKPEQRLAAPEAVPAPELEQPAHTRRREPLAVPKTPSQPAATPSLAYSPQSALHGALAATKPAIPVTGAAGYLAQQAAAAPVNLPPQAQSAFAADGSFPPSAAAQQTAQLRMQATQTTPATASGAVPQPMQQNDVVTAAGIADSLSDIPATSDSSAKFAALLPELPSHQETVSSISNGMATVAVDAGGAVFESRDDGKHWKTVEAQWAGRPVRVSLEESRTEKKRAIFASSAAAPIAPVEDNASLDRRRSGVAGQAELHGTVTDQSGAVIPRARIQVRAAGTPGEGITVLADGQGRFAVPGLPAGRYEVVVTSPGFATLTQVLNLDAGVQTGMNATLQVGAAAETVTVQSNAPVKAQANTPAFQLTTDTGAVWVSSDGRSWKRR